jgi:hypothetical protein
MYLPATNSLGFSTNGANAVYIDASQNVGIGTNTPSTYGKLGLSVSATASAVTKVIGFQNNAGVDAASLRIAGYNYANNVQTAIDFIQNSSSNFQSQMAFSTNNGGGLVEAMRIDSSGNLLVGRTGTDPTAATGIILTPGNTGNITQSINTATNSNHYLLYNLNATNTGYRFYVNANGGIYNYSANNVNLSDRREKTNFAPAGDYLSKICAIPIQTYNYIDQNLEEDGGLTLGVVAQDVQVVAPELVNESNWGTEEEPKMRLSIYQTDLQYALMKCIQEQQAFITSLTARITALESKG